MLDLAIGGAAGGSGDRVDSAHPIVQSLIRRGGPAALTFENLAERTLAFAQLAKRANPDAGYEPLMELEVAPVLADCMAHGIPIISNFGAANPLAAARQLQRLAARLGLPAPRIAVIEGDDLSGERGMQVIKPLLPKDHADRPVMSANAYLGAFAIAGALKAGAQIVVAGRVADPALTLGPSIAHYGWGQDDLDALAGATMAVVCRSSENCGAGVPVNVAMACSNWERWRLSTSTCVRVVSSRACCCAMSRPEVAPRSCLSVASPSDLR